MTHEWRCPNQHQWTTPSERPGTGGRCPVCAAPAAPGDFSPPGERPTPEDPRSDHAPDAVVRATSAVDPPRPVPAADPSIGEILREACRAPAGGGLTGGGVTGGPLGDPRPALSTVEQDFRLSPVHGSSRLPSIPGYEVLRVIGRGGMGVVYLASQLGLNRLVAIKTLLSEGDTDAGRLTRFRLEAEAVARLRHPNIVQIYEIGDAGGVPYLSLEYVSGGTLDARLRGGLLPAAAAARLLKTLAEAVHHAHTHGIVHRDLKPANILLAAPDAGLPPADGDAGGGVPKITDFGLAKRTEVESGQTRTGDVLGTPSYMAPEQAAGRGSAIGPPTDVYALGAILYEVLTGRPPFRGPTAFETVFQVLSAEPVPPTRLQPGLSPVLETICLACLRKDPARRYPSALALAQDLGRFLAHEPIVARRPGVVARAGLWFRRRPVRALIVPLAVLALARVAVTVWWEYRADRRHADELRSAYEELGLYQAANHDVARARETAGRLLALAPEDPAALYQAARITARATTDGDDAEAADALALLRRSAAAGYFRDPDRVRALESDQAFDRLRGRDRFRTVLAEVRRE